jgi:hypothetical protein
MRTSLEGCWQSGSSRTDSAVVSERFGGVRASA